MAYDYLNELTARHAAAARPLADQLLRPAATPQPAAAPPASHAREWIAALLCLTATVALVALRERRARLSQQRAEEKRRRSADRANDRAFAAEAAIARIWDQHAAADESTLKRAARQLVVLSPGSDTEMEDDDERWRAEATTALAAAFAGFEDEAPIAGLGSAGGNEDEATVVEEATFAAFGSATEDEATTADRAGACGNEDEATTAALGSADGTVDEATVTAERTDAAVQDVERETIREIEVSAIRCVDDDRKGDSEARPDMTAPRAISPPDNDAPPRPEAPDIPPPPSVRLATPPWAYGVSFDESTMEAPDQYLCPLSLRVMREPVLAADGHTYVRFAPSPSLLTPPPPRSGPLWRTGSSTTTSRRLPPPRWPIPS